MLLSSCYAAQETSDLVQVVLGVEDRYMVLCSDGIYEFMTNDDIVNLVHAQAEQGALAAQIAQHLVRPRADFPECWCVCLRAAGRTSNVPLLLSLPNVCSRR